MDGGEPKVKGEPKKMAPGDREQLRACCQPEKPSCQSAHVHERTSQRARCCFRETEAECLSSSDGLGCPGKRLTRGNVPFI